MSTAEIPGLSRRAMLGTTAAIGAGLPLAGLGTASAVAKVGGDSVGGAAHSGSVRAAVRFLQRVTDAYRPSGFRLAQSYSEKSTLGDVGFVYDNALAVIALLSVGDTPRARAIGDALLYAQSHDAEHHDYRLRQAYHVNEFVDAAGVAISAYQLGLSGTAVGDMAWAGLALAHLANRTGDQTYLTGALRIGQWIVDNTYSTSGLGGYTFGETENLEAHKSAEHNTDVYGLFRLLAQLSADAVWTRRAEHAWEFLERVWNADDGFFFAGSDDGVAVNQKPLERPADVQSWSWLAAGKRQYARALDWAVSNLAQTDTPVRVNSTLTGNYSVSGIGFGSGTLRADTTANIGGQPWNPRPDDGGVWFEGTAQLALALRKRHADGDAERYAFLMSQLRSAQTHLGQDQTFAGRSASGGVVAASSPIDTGFRFGYFPNVHVGATSWSVFAASGFNPFRFSG